MKIDSIRRYLRPQTIMSRKSTFSNAFASALAPHDAFSGPLVAEAMRDLGKDPTKDLSCVYCGEPAATWDHVFNRVIKGEFSGHGHHIRNLVPCCRTCNERKGQRHWRDWLASVGVDDEAERADRIERFLTPLESQQVAPEQFQRLAGKEMARYLEIRQLVFDLLQEADGLAASIRQKTGARPATEVSTDDGDRE